jgi:hypothetical protein
MPPRPRAALPALLALALLVSPTLGLAQLPGVKKVKDAAGKLKPPAAAPAPQPAPAAAPASAPAAGDTAGTARADPKVWENYDFIPGNRVIFFTDFSEDRVGNFARGLKYKAGAMDVVDVDGVKLLRATSRSQFLIPAGKRLPERFTLEFDVVVPGSAVTGYDVLAFEGGAELDRSGASAEVNWAPGGTVIIGGGQTAGSSDAKIPDPMLAGLRGQVAHVRVLMDSAYFKLYVNERRMYNIPELAFRRDSVIRVFLRGSEEPGLAFYLARIRVAESETDVLYDALAARGRWATQGILFATAKAELQPESRPVLKEIATTLGEHPDLRILIEGHTDNVGAAAANLKLSDARAAAVKAALVSQFGIAEDRITTTGLGDTSPAVPNTTPAGRAQNRRVEVVKQ